MAARWRGRISGKIKNLFWGLLLMLPLAGWSQSQAGEPIFVHTDRQLYICGETVWLSLFIRNTSKPSSSLPSSLAYLELLDRDSRPVLQIKLRLRNGRGQGHLTIPLSLASDAYLLRAYTPKLKAIGPEAFFETVLYVVNPQKPPSDFHQDKDSLSVQPSFPAKDLGLALQKNTYHQREKVSLSLTIFPSDLSAGPLSLSVSVRKIQPELQSQSTNIVTVFSDPDEKIQAVKQGIEASAPVISGTFIPPPGKSLPASILLSFPGKRPELYATTVHQDGSFQLAVSPSIQSEQVVFWTPETSLAGAKINLIPAFSESNSPSPLHPFLPESWRPLIESYLLNAQVNRMYQSEPVTSPQPKLAFYGEPKFSYHLDDYTRFPNLEEVFLEYIRYGIRRRVDDKKYIFLWDEYANTFTISNNIQLDSAALVLLDGIPLLNPDDIWSLDVLAIADIDLIPKRLYIGQHTFQGLVHLRSYQGDFAGLKLPHYVIQHPYIPLQTTRTFEAPVYHSLTLLHSPRADFRSTLHWEPDFVLSQANDSLSFYTSDDEGLYLIEVMGSDISGKPFYATHQFTVSSERLSDTAFTLSHKSPVSGHAISVSKPPPQAKATDLERTCFHAQGKEYAYFYPRVAGNHLLDKQEKLGRILYDGIWQEAVELNYDLFHDLVFITQVEENLRRNLIIHPEKISRFEIDQRVFVNLNPGTDSLLPAGIYEMAFQNASVSYLIKRRIEQNEDLGNLPGEKQDQFVAKDRHYLYHRGQLTRIRYRKDVLRVFGGDPLVKQKLKEAKIRLFHKRPDFQAEMIRFLSLDPVD